MADEPEVTVEVTPGDDHEDTPAVVDTSSDTVVVTQPANDDGDTDRWVQNERRLAAIEDAVTTMAQAQSLALAEAETARAEAEAAQAAAAEAAAEDQDEDEIIPKRTHGWFRPWREWAGTS